MKKSVKIVISLVLILILAVAGFFIGKYYVVNYAFNRFVGNGLTDIVVPADNQPSAQETTSDEPVTSENEDEQNPPVGTMSDRDVILKVMNDSALMSKLSSMVSYSDKERVFAIILSNFSSKEISHYAALAAKGLDSATKSQLISIAKSRLSSAQLSECMQIAYKYADQLRPFLKNN